MNSDIFDSLPIVVCETAPVYDDAGEVVDLEWIAANSLMSRSILPDGGSIIGMRIFEFDPSYRGSEMVRAVMKVLETGEPETLITRQGRAATMLSKVMKTSLIRTERGVLSCSHEITDIAQERDEAIGKAELLRIACDSANHAISITNRDGDVLYINEALAALSGYTSEELVGGNISRIFGARAVENASRMFESVERGERLQNKADTELVSASDERIRVSVAMNSAFLPQAEEPVFITHIQDVREERRKAHELRTALYNAEQATRLKSEFLANMSHEIRTPLNGVLGMAQALSHDSLTPTQTESVEIILDSGRALMALLNDILDLSKIEAGKLEVSPVASDLRHKLSGLFKLHESTAQEKGIALKMHVDPAVPSRLMLDPVRVRQCVGNLLSNAIKFTQQGEVMLVVTCADAPDGEAMVTIHVTDTGCGIAPDKLDHIFTSFSQEDGSTTRRFGGSGLGLSITRQLARMMGGDVTAASEPGRGSVFKLSFAAEPVAGHKPGNADNTVAMPRRKTRTGLSGARALVVDDNSINLRVARSFLDGHGMDILEANNGNEALDILQDNAVDIVLMDIHMPGLDGIEALKQLRLSASQNRFVPVVALTADGMQGDRERFLGMGFDGYVSKPIDERTLISVIGQVLSAQATSGQVRAAG